MFATTNTNTATFDENTFTLSFADVQVSEGGGVNLPNGVFPAVVQSGQIVIKEGKAPQVEFKIEITEPDYAGAVRTMWIGLQASTPEKQKSLMQIWGAALLSIGVPHDKLASVQIVASQIPAAFAGKDCLVEVKDRTKMDGTLTQEVNFLKPATYANKRKLQDAAGGPVARELPSTTPTAPTPPSAPTPLPSALPQSSVMPSVLAAPTAPTAPAAPAAGSSESLSVLLGGR